MKKIHEIFPLIVYQGSLECHKKFKEDNLEEVKEYWFNGYEYESPEASSRIFLHLNENCSELFKNLRTVFDEYFETFDFFFARFFDIHHYQ